MNDNLRRAVFALAATVLMTAALVAAGGTAGPGLPEPTPTPTTTPGTWTATAVPIPRVVMW